jgi:hypothetical protein
VINFKSLYTKPTHVSAHTHTHTHTHTYISAHIPLPHVNRILESMLCIFPIIYWKSFASLENKTGLITSFWMWHEMTGHLVPNNLQSSGPSYKGHKDLKTLGTKCSMVRYQYPEELTAQPHYCKNVKICKIGIYSSKPNVKSNKLVLKLPSLCFLQILDTGIQNSAIGTTQRFQCCYQDF